MRGKRLFNLLSELNKTEHRQLLNQCKISTDKRAQDLYELLQKRSHTESVFEKHLSQIAIEAKENIKDGVEKIISRWIDFACKEVESLFLKNKLQIKEVRNEELSRIFYARENKELSQYYNHFVMEHSKKEKKHSLLIRHYNMEYNWLVGNPTKKNIEKMQNLLLLKIESIENFNLEALSITFISLSSTYIDEPTSISESKLNDYKIDLTYYLSKTKNEYLLGLLYNADCRFSFFNINEFKVKLSNLAKLIDSLNDQNPKHYATKRYYHFIYSLGGIYYGFPIDNIQKHSEKMFKLVKKEMGKDDTISMFFMLFTTILQKDFEKYDKLLETYESKCFQTENQYYIFFLNGLKAYLNKNYKKAIENLLEITYSNHKYMAIWGKLLEIRIHKDLGDHKIVDMLKDRAIRFLKTNQSQLFYYNPSMKCLELLDAPESEKRNEHLFDFYKLILLGNTEKQQTQ
jgi:hypothetical protein